MYASSAVRAQHFAHLATSLAFDAHVWRSCVLKLVVCIQNARLQLGVPSNECIACISANGMQHVIHWQPLAGGHMSCK